MKRTYVLQDKQQAGPVYLDCNATAPIEPDVAAAMRAQFEEDVGNAGSRTHEHGARAKRAVQSGRERVAALAAADPDEVVFTSGATEANNLALLGIAEYGLSSGRKHIVTTAIEHKAVLEPLERLRTLGFDVEHIAPDRSGAIQADLVRSAMRPDTLLVSVMHANNETGIIQPIAEIAEALGGHEAYLHVDAAQTFGKLPGDLSLNRLDLISVTSHKVYGPVGIGALIARKRSFRRPPLRPLMVGGGQERGLRPGTLPVALIVGFGAAASLAGAEHVARRKRCEAIRAGILSGLDLLRINIHGTGPSLPHVLNFSIPGVDSEALMVALKDLVSISNGSACTSQSYEPSHVLEAMDLGEAELAGAVRLSWCHMTPDVDWKAVCARVHDLL